MGLLDKLKGFIKLSEVSADSAQSLLDTAVREDASTVFSQTVSALEDALRRQSIILTSTGPVTWSLNKLTPESGTNIILKLTQNSNGQVVNLLLNYPDFSAGLSFPNDGDILYIELNRNLISSGTIQIYNGGINIGQRALVASTMPSMINSQSGSFQGTICIPIAVRQGTNLWWIVSGFYWPNGESDVIGGIGTTPPVPTGSILNFSGNETNVPSGYLFCDGSPKVAIQFPALAQLLWRPSTGSYIYGGSTAPIGTQTPPGNFNLPDLRGLFVKGAGSHGSLINGKQYSATLAVKDSDRTAINDLSVVAGGTHNHAYFDYQNGPERTDSCESGGERSGWRDYDGGIPVTDYAGSHNHSISSTDQQTHPAHMGLNYIIKV
ncbi:MAG: tail fiber protein [Proteobacteria bacterium]|nr:tail fiber protein [Pseudomonadota bacterium]NBP13555.1 tail fiber protein [bacterium]